MGRDRPSAGASGSRAQARESFERREWANACTILAAADPATLELDDVERLAVASYLTGNDEQSDHAWLLAHERCLVPAM
jgi:hypothetical protein